LYEKFVSNDSDCGSKTIELTENVRKKSRDLFYREWEKVKEGEPVYRYVKAGAMGMIFGIIPPLILIWSIWISHPPELVPVYITYAIYIIMVLVYLVRSKKQNLTKSSS
jgi:hypothetical protein